MMRRSKPSAILGFGAESAQSAYDDVIQANGDVALVVSNLKKWLGENTHDGLHRHDGSEIN